MNWAEHELNHVVDFQEVILFMKNMGLIKDKSKKLQFHKNIGEICYE